MFEPLTLAAPIDTIRPVSHERARSTHVMEHNRDSKAVAETEMGWDGMG